MNLDALGRDAGRGTRQAAAHAVDVEARLGELRRAHHRRQATSRAGAVATLVAVLVGAAVLVSAGPREFGPVDRLEPPIRTCTVASCSGSGEFRVGLGAPFTWVVPEGYEQLLTGTTVAVRPQASSDRSPLLVLQDVRGGDYRSEAMTPSTAQSLSEHVQAMPGLEATDLRPTTLGGLPALHLRVTPSTGLILLGTSQPIPEPDRLDEAWFPRTDTFDIREYLQKTWAYVPTPGKQTRIWLVDLPGGPLTAVVAPVSSDEATTQAQDALLTSLRFPTTPN